MNLDRLAELADDREDDVEEKFHKENVRVVSEIRIFAKIRLGNSEFCRVCQNFVEITSGRPDNNSKCAQMSNRRYCQFTKFLLFYIPMCCRSSIQILVGRRSENQRGGVPVWMPISKSPGLQRERQGSDRTFCPRFWTTCEVRD